MKQIISASRRTDIPRWFLSETLSYFKKGQITLENPFNKVPYTVSLKKEYVSCIVWWSKDYSVFLINNAYLLLPDYNHYFQFTINGYLNEKMQKLLEPGVTSDLNSRLLQLYELVNIYSPEQITWRFDPIVFWTENGVQHDNIVDFEYISKKVSGCGIKRCTISFAQWYGKCIRRANAKKFNFFEPSKSSIKQLANELATINKENGIQTYSCSYPLLINNPLIQKSSCIDGNVLSKLFGKDIVNTKDPGQRHECGCAISKDIGRYNMVCKHGCIYCYANPKI